MKMYDIHSHILYGVDDGAACIEESIEMVLQAAKGGIKTMIATPHYIEGLHSNNYKDNLDKFNNLIRETDRLGIDMKIYLGNEVLITPELPELIKYGVVAPLNNSRYILIELPFFDIPSYTEKVLFNLEMGGYRAILAHPERNEHIINDLNILYDFIRRGALVQMNISSIKGAYGKRVYKAALKMLKCRMVHFVGTDMHSPEKRQLDISSAIKTLEIHCPDQVNKLLQDNPRRIIINEPIIAGELCRIGRT